MNGTDHGASMREHSWRYFEVHAGQRITVFNYFLVASGAIAAGLARPYRERLDLLRSVLPLAFS